MNPDVRSPNSRQGALPGSRRRTLAAALLCGSALALGGSCRTPGPGLSLELAPGSALGLGPALSGCEQALGGLDLADRERVERSAPLVRLEPPGRTRPHLELRPWGRTIEVPADSDWIASLAHEFGHLALRANGPAPAHWIEEGLCELAALRAGLDLVALGEKLAWLVGQGRTSQVEWRTVAGPEAGAARLWPIPSSLPAAKLRAAFSEIEILDVRKVQRGGSRARELAAVPFGQQRFYAESMVHCLWLLERDGGGWQGTLGEFAERVERASRDLPAEGGGLDPTYLRDLLGDVLTLQAGGAAFAAPHRQQEDPGLSTRWTLSLDEELLRTVSATQPESALRTSFARQVLAPRIAQRAAHPGDPSIRRPH
jgi:hypothetical protein